MPGYYQRSMAGQLPLTPPDSGSGYGYSTMYYPQDPYASHQSVGQCRQDSAHDYHHQAYMQPPVAPAPPTYQYQNTYQASTSLPPIQYYEPMGAPILPPLRIHDRVPFADDYQRRLQEEQQQAAAREQQKYAAKEEKATGGVSAKLDYEMDRMTDFVSQAVQSMYAFHKSPVCMADIDMTRSFQHQMQSQPTFHKWVHQVLSATRLPSATILLSLHYLNDRLTMWPDSVPRGENQIYRLLAVSLILGSKFLDDNTFINRSWSDVTAIKVSELNMLEMKWLHLINYDLHVEPKDGLQAWIDAWKKYDAEVTAKLQQQTRLSPLDTNVHRHPTTSRDRYSPYPTPYTASTASTRSFDGQLSARSSQFSTPYSAADPWTSSQRQADDYYKGQDRYPTAYDIEDAARRASEERARQTAYQYAQSAHQSYYQPSYASAWDQSAWNGVHRYDCNCSACAYQHHYRPYPMASSYAAQTVMG